MVLIAVYLHKRKAEEVKAGLGVFTGVLFPPVCVCVWCRLLLSADTDCPRPMSACLIEALPDRAQDRSKPRPISPHTGAKAAAFRIMYVWGAGVQLVF